MIPLDQATELYSGMGEPGLYPGGGNEPSGDHAAYGDARTAEIEPLDAAGMPSADGLIGLLSVGLSNTNQKWSRFEREADRAGEHGGRVVLINGAQGGVDAIDMSNERHPYWANLDARIASSGVAPEQIQAVWLLQSLRGEDGVWPTAPQTLRDGIRAVIDLIVSRFPNIRVIYLSSRTYGGFIGREPYVYETAFAVKWLIEDQVDALAGGSVDEGPWLAWGPYLWANGACPTDDGLFYLNTDFEDDGANVHPDIGAETKVADLLRRFFSNDSRTSGWYGPSDVQVMTLDAVGDATVVETTPDTSDGAAITLEVGPGRDVHVRFELPALAPEDLEHAKLSLFVDPFMTGREISVHVAADDDWDEASLTWNDAPTLVEPAIAQTGRYSRGSAMSANVTDAVRSALASGVINLTLRATEQTVLFSKENGDGPRLVLSARGEAPVPDAGGIDAGVDSDAMVDPDGGSGDGGAADASADAGGETGGNGCGCRAGSQSGGIVWPLVALAWIRRRRA